MWLFPQAAALRFCSNGNSRDAVGARSSVRIPTKKIAHSELMTIRSSPSDAVESIVAQVIVMGQEKRSGMQSTSFRFWICRGRCLRKLCLSTPLALHLPHSHRQIPPIIQWHFHGSDLLEEADEVLQTGDRSTARLIE